jgi:hypothetical protein
MTQLNLFEKRTTSKKVDQRKVQWAKEQRTARAHLRVAKAILAERKARAFQALLIASMEERA